MRVIVFDAYGTLLDVHSAVQRHAARLGPGAGDFSALWRQKQLEYSWVRALTGRAHHADFLTCTRDALAHCAAVHGVADQALLADLLAAYLRLDPYPEVPAMLAALRARGLRTAVLSNGAPAMLEAGFAPLAGLLDRLISVEEAGVFKPDPRVYALPARHFGLPASAMGFVSANPWDSQAARHAGFRVFRVNRTAAPDEYGLAAAGVPSLPDLASLPDLIE
jgi:2-haloacid dehalogenase